MREEIKKLCIKFAGDQAAIPMKDEQMVVAKMLMFCKKNTSVLFPGKSVRIPKLGVDGIIISIANAWGDGTTLEKDNLEPCLIVHYGYMQSVICHPEEVELLQ